MNYGVDFDAIIANIVKGQHNDLLMEVEFWKEKAWEAEKSKKLLENEVANIKSTVAEQKKENFKASVLSSIMDGLSEEDILGVLKMSINDKHGKYYDTPLLFSILLDNPDINKELIDKMECLGISLPRNIEKFTHPSNYTKEQLLEIAKKRSNFYVTNGNLFQDNYSYFYSASKQKSFCFDVEVESLPLQLLFKNKMLLDDEVYDAFLQNNNVSKYMFRLPKFQDLPYEKVLKLLSKTANKKDKKEILTYTQCYHDKPEMQEVLLNVCTDNKWSDVNISKLTDENKVRYFKNKKYSLEDVLKSSADLKFSEETLKYIFKNLL